MFVMQLLLTNRVFERERACYVMSVVV